MNDSIDVYVDGSLRKNKFGGWFIIVGSDLIISYFHKSVMFLKNSQKAERNAVREAIIVTNQLYPNSIVNLYTDCTNNFSKFMDTEKIKLVYADTKHDYSIKRFMKHAHRLARKGAKNSERNYKQLQLRKNKICLKKTV